MGFLPVPEGQSSGAIIGGLVAEAQQIRGGDAAVGLTQRKDRAAVDAVRYVGVRVDRVDRYADVLPVHLRGGVLRSVGSEKHREWEGRGVGDVGEGGQAQGITRPDLCAQVGYVGLCCRIVAFV